MYMRKWFFVLIVLELICILEIAYYTHNFLYSLENAWFFYAILFISITQFSRAFYLKLDSSFYIASLLLFLGFVGIIQYVFLLKLKDIYPLYIFSVPFASFMVFVFFRQNIHLKIFAILSGLVLILYIYKVNIISNFVFTICISLYLLFILVMLHYSWRKNQRRT